MVPAACDGKVSGVTMDQQTRSMPHPAPQAASMAGLRRRALRFSLIYFLAASAWIALTDRLLNLLDLNPALMPVLNTSKGLLFILVTAGVFYVVVCRLGQAIRAEAAT